MIQDLKTSPKLSGAGSKKTGFYIGATCPGCGGTLSLEDDFFVLRCEHCDSVLRVIMPDRPSAYLVPFKASHSEIRFKIDRYLKEHDLPLTDSSLQLKSIYYPYWHVEGILLKLRNKVYEREVGVDSEYSKAEKVREEKREISLSRYSVTSAGGPEMQGVPPSLGMRSDYMRLMPFSDENIAEEATAVGLARNWVRAVEDVRRSVGHLGNLSIADFGKNVTEFYRPIGSVIFFPFVISESYARDDYHRFVVDGVHGKIIEHNTAPPPLTTETVADSVEMNFGKLDIAFHRCSVCGSDFPPERTYVSICKNCQGVSFFEGERPGFEGIYMADKDAVGEEEYFPFWIYRVPEEHASEVKRLFGGIFESDWLAVPAFKTSHFEAMYRLSKRISSALPEIDVCEVPSHNQRFRSVSLPEEEARIVAELVIRRRRLKESYTASEAQEIDFERAAKRLVFIPFKKENYFFVDTITQAVTFEKSSIV